MTYPFIETCESHLITDSVVPKIQFVYNKIMNEILIKQSKFDG